MALQDITTKILDDARARAKEITKSATVEVERIAADTERINKQLGRDRDAELDAELSQRERTVLSRARRDARAEISNAKRALIDAVFADATKKITEASDADYTQFITGLVATVPADAIKSAKEIRVPAARVAVSQQVITGANVVADESVTAGFVVIGESADFDATLERVMADAQQATEGEVAATLFPA